MYNAFISYAWRDNKDCGLQPQGWISVFVDRLSKHLNRELARDIAADGIWLDYERMRGNDHITTAVRKQLESSRLLIPILSKAWLDSSWCRQELEIFLGLHGSTPNRLFPVWMEPVENPPSPLDDLLKYKFWYQDQSKQPRTRWFPDPDSIDRDYSALQQDMARDMAKRLLEITGHEEAIQPQAEAPSLPSLSRPNRPYLVLVNGGDDDWELVERVAEHLYLDHGIGYALPLRAGNGLKSSEINRDLREKLKVCHAVLLVYHQGPANQLHQHITGFLQATTNRPRMTSLPSLTLCQPCGTSIRLGYRPPQMRILECCTQDLSDCAAQIAGLLP